MVQINDKKIVASSFLLLFRDNVLALKQIISEYITFITNMKIKYKKDINFSMSEDEKNYVANISNQIRTLINLTYVDYNILNEDKEDEKKIKKLYEEINKNFVIEAEPLLDYVKLLNELLFKENIKELLDMAQLTKNIFLSETMLQENTIPEDYSENEEK